MATNASTKKRSPQAKALSRKDLLNSTKREPLGHLLTEQTLREAGFRGMVSTDPEMLAGYANDESIFSITPQIILQPQSTRDIEVAVEVLSAHKEFTTLSLTPRAAGTGLSGGSLTDSIVLDVQKHLTYIGEPKRTGTELYITTQPGAMWKDVETKLKKVEHYLPAFPASKDLCTIGGAVANNCAGPDSLKHGHMADWIHSLDVVLYDGKTYTVRPLSYKEFYKLTKQAGKNKNALADMAKSVYTLIKKNEKVIARAKPKTAKNSAGYALWDVIDTSVKDFESGSGTFDLTRLFSGSQGTIGVISSITLKTAPIVDDSTLIVVPIFDLTIASKIITTALTFEPRNVEVYDALTHQLALRNPDFFKQYFEGVEYLKALVHLYTNHHVRNGQISPEFTLLITLDTKEVGAIKEALTAIRKIKGASARTVSNPIEQKLLWTIRRSSYTLSKLEDPTKRPAAFLEDMTVPPQKLGAFFTEIKQLLKKYHLTTAVHGHGGNGHFHFYPLMDFTKKSTVAQVEKMAEEFFNAAIKHGGNICGEHNDGIIRTPHLNKLFSKNALALFEEVESLLDPHDIFNPGKKVNPRFSVKENIRTSN